jgi:hypothetical protein
MPATHCTDPVVGAILSGWRYDISGLSPAMRTDYEDHLATCLHCRSKERLHRTIDVLLISVSTLSILAFLLAVAVIHRVEALTHIGAVHVQLHQLHHATITISLEAVAFAGLFFSMLLWVLVAVATPLPGFLGGIVRNRIPAERLPANLRDRIMKNHA